MYRGSIPVIGALPFLARGRDGKTEFRTSG